MAIATFLTIIAFVIPAVPAEAQFVVNSTLDEDDLVIGDGQCVSTPSGQCTLRAAIREANVTAGADDIIFNIPASDPGFVAHVGTSDTVPCFTAPAGSPCWWRIGLPLGPLPTLTDSGTRVRGSTQTTNVADTNLGIVGTGGTVGVDACLLPTYARPEIAIDGNLAARAFDIDGAANNILIEGMAVYNTTTQAIRADGPSTPPGTNRVIGVSPSEPTSQPMFVGVLPDGSDPFFLTPLKSNLGFGVQVTSAPGGITGYFLDVLTNFIGFNGRGGIDGTESTSVLVAIENEVFDNGWNSNAHDGIDVNGINGLVECNLSRDNTNNEGLGTIPRGGAGNGIEVGSKSAATAAVISNNVIRNNTVRGNLSAGVSVRKGATGNIVDKNVATDNEIGISVDQETREPTHRNLISRNSIFMNMSIGIDLQHEVHTLNPLFLAGDTDWYGNATPPNIHVANQGPDGVTPNDLPCDADGYSNRLQNWPVLTSVIKSGTAALVSGTLDSTANHLFRIEFFATPDGVLFASGDREGQRFLGQVDVMTDGNCNATFSENLSGVNDDDVITATATDITASSTLQNNTSEFSNSFEVTVVTGLKVTGGGFVEPPFATIAANCETPCVDPDASTPTRANFGVNAKYLAHFGTVPQGHTNFRARAQNLHLSSTEYEDGSLQVVPDGTGKRFQWRGKGKLNNQPGYCFQVNGRDEQQGNEPQSTEKDGWRIKIWKQMGSDCSDETDVRYDNDPAAALSGFGTTGGTPLGGGNLEVHD